MNLKPIHEAKNADLRGSYPAIQRAALRARELAVRTGTAIVISRNGVVELLDPTAPEPEMARAQEAPASYGDQP